ncbi:MAG: D-alanine--D-alanine ligase [Bacteroidia bacterium]|nr:D-alanine--D-alanine ligase [Bacteroidia bacterium]
MKTRIGILFGGSSREREISFAGGRTVYDNLDKELFEPIPLFVDSFGNVVHINWEYIYKGSIRDFYPPVSALPETANNFQIYAESLGHLDESEVTKLNNSIGTPIAFSELRDIIDFAFLCLHGSDGEDGRIQGLMEFYKIPYSGSGVYSSSIGINKALQKEVMQKNNFNVPEYKCIQREEWIGCEDKEALYNTIAAKIDFPFVVKAANQGSSIGVTVVTENSFEKFFDAMESALFVKTLKQSYWNELNHDEKLDFIRSFVDLRDGIGIPVKIGRRIVSHPDQLFSIILQLFSEYEEEIFIEAVDGESEVVIESFINGKEFSCIVIEDENGKPIALPPTQIVKGNELFDYRSKYLPGLARKITPIDLAHDKIENIRAKCESLYTSLKFNVYARIDGFIQEDGEIYLNDPNTTSGMLPSSFFFHQAAEIGLNPSEFITYIIVTSLQNRTKDFRLYGPVQAVLKKVNRNIDHKRAHEKDRKKIAVIMGGYSAERHISVESGRNVYEKLASTDKYEPIPVFLIGDENKYELYKIPINILLKDNADDIKDKILNYHLHPVVQDIISQCKDISEKFSAVNHLESPSIISITELSELCDSAFIALHGRPGEDGNLQSKLTEVGLPFNGSRFESSSTTIDKYKTNEHLTKNGLLGASHMLVKKEDWIANPEKTYEQVLGHFKFPFVAKPVDDGCSAAVKVIKNNDELDAFSKLLFRDKKELIESAANTLNILPKEELPNKNVYLVEELIEKLDASKFIEVTVGLLTYFDDDNKLVYEVFEPSETFAEGEVLTLEEKFLAGEGQNITPARFSSNPGENQLISKVVKKEIEKAAALLNIEGYARIDAFVRIYGVEKVEVVFIEANSLPGMTPATCIFHQAAINNYKPYEFLDKIIEFGVQRNRMLLEKSNS